MEILDFGPKSINVNEPFNQQPDGKSVLWIQASKVSLNTKIYGSGAVLYTSVAPINNMVSARVPAWMYEFPGKLEFKLIDESLDEESTPITINVQGDGSILEISDDSLPQKYLEIQKELHQLKEKFPAQFTGWGLSTSHALA